MESSQQNYKLSVNIITAILAILAIIMSLPLIPPYIESISFQPALRLYIQFIFQFVIIIIMVALGFIQRKKSTPRLMMMFSGAVTFYAPSLLMHGWMLPGLCLLAAGLLPAIYQIKSYTTQTEMPYKCEKGGLLNAAGGLACVYTVCRIINWVLVVIDCISYSPPRPLVLFFRGLDIIICYACLTVVCFIKHKRKSVLYRMFFIGMPTASMLFSPIDIFIPSNIVIPADILSPFVAELIRCFITVILFSIVLLVIIHTLKTLKNDGIIPQETAQIPAE